MLNINSTTYKTIKLPVLEDCDHSIRTLQFLNNLVTSIVYYPVDILTIKINSYRCFSVLLLLVVFTIGKWRTKYKLLTHYIPLLWVYTIVLSRDDSMDESIWTVNHRYISLWCLRTAQFLLSAVNHRYLIHCVRIQRSYVTIIT